MSKQIKATLAKQWVVIDSVVRDAIEHGWHRKAYKHVDPPPMTDEQLEYLFDRLANTVGDALRDTIELGGEQ